MPSLDRAREVLLQFEQLRTLSSQTRSADGGALSAATMPLCRVHYALTKFYHASGGQLPQQISAMKALRGQVIQLVSNSDRESGVIRACVSQRKSAISLLNARNLQCFGLAPRPARALQAPHLTRAL